MQPESGQYLLVTLFHTFWAGVPPVLCLIALTGPYSGHGHVYTQPSSGSSEGIKFCTILVQCSPQPKSAHVFYLPLVVPGVCLDYAVVHLHAM